MTGSGDGRVVAPDRAASGALLQDAGLPQDAAALAPVGEYLQRTKRARRWGLVAGLIVFFVVGGQGTSPFALGVAVVLVGYLLGVLLGELSAPRRRRGTVRLASLQPREKASLLPVWAYWAPWVTLLPAAGAPLLLLVRTRRVSLAITIRRRRVLPWSGGPVAQCPGAVGGGMRRAGWAGRVPADRAPTGPDALPR